MKTLLVRYKLLPERVEENERLVRAVFERLAASRPSGVRYATFKAADSLTFFHLARIEAPGGVNPLADLEEFKAFTARIAERCSEPPVTTVLEEVGAYEVFQP